MAVAAPAAAAPRSGGLAYHWQAMIVIVMGTFMVILDSTIVNIAMPRIIQVFGSTIEGSQLVLTGYMVALAVVMPATGYISERFGAKPVYLLTVLLFTVGSALCGFAWNVESLIVFRVLQGLGGGMMQPLGMSILLQAAPPSQRGSIMGVFGLPILVAPVIGPTLGGYIVEYLDWRIIFTLNIPIGVAAILAGIALLRPSQPRGGQTFDFAGFVLAAVGFSAALLALDKAPADGWTAPHVVALWLVAAAALPAWVIVELSVAQPLLDLSILKDRTYSIALVVTFVTTVALFGALLLLPLFLQSVRGLGAMETGLLLFPQAVAAGIMMPVSGKLIDKIDPRWLVIPGLVILATSTFMLTRLDLNTPDPLLRIILVMRGLSMGMMMMPVTTIALDNLQPWQIPRASALTNVFRQLFSAFGTGMMTSILLDRERFHTALLQQVVTPDNLAAVRVLNTVKVAMAQSGASDLAAQVLGLRALAGQVTRASAVLSFQDCFFLAAMLAVFGIIPALFLTRGRAYKLAKSGGPAPKAEGHVMME